MPYTVSKEPLNVWMLEASKQEEAAQEGQCNRTMYQAVSPGHCKTTFKVLKGERDPFEGFKVVKEKLFRTLGETETGFWQWEGDEVTGEFKRILW
jgi:hypothetical protein